MGAPLKLPGILGALAESMGGFQYLATGSGIPVRTLRQWAHNQRATDAILAHTRLAPLCEALRVRPITYRAPGGEEVVSTPYGWITGNERWMGDPAELAHAVLP
jgi:hypothetical protein